MRWIATTLVPLLLLTLLAACGGDDDTADPQTPAPADGATVTTAVPPGAAPQPATATVAAAPTSATSRAPTASASVPATTQPDAAVTAPSTGGQPLVGDVSVDDPTGDVVSMFDETPLVGEFPGADLVSVRVTGDGSTLTVTFVASTPFPSQSTDHTSEWYLDIHTNGLLYDEIKLFNTAGDWTVTYYDFRTADLSGTELDVEPVVDGTLLAVTIPTGQVPGVAAPFAWSGASTITDGGDMWTDAVPDEATGLFYDVDELPQFP
jgi:hypothetical protein